jgi:hypothetical protein
VSFSTTRFSKAKKYPRPASSKEASPIILREGVKA